MAQRDVVVFPDPLLKQRCASLESWGGDFAALADDLIDTMRAHPGCVGLAAPQIGVLARVVVVEAGTHKKSKSDNGLLVLADPHVIGTSGESIRMREGCLSIPDFTGDVVRAEAVTVCGVAPDGSEKTVSCDAYEARVMLHELDHLDGILFLDRVRSAHDIFPRKQFK